MTEADEPAHDETDEYDREHGTPTLADTTKPSGLTDAKNKPPPEHQSFRVTSK